MQSTDFKIAKEKLNQAVKLMKEKKIDTWLILTREGTDLNVPLLLGVRSVHQAAIFINQNGKHVAITSESDRGNYQQSELYLNVIAYQGSLKETFLDYFGKLSPQKMALNISENDYLCDGLTMGQYLWLEECIGKEKIQEIELPSEELLMQLRSEKSATEIEILKKAISLTDEIYKEVIDQIQCGMTEIEIGDLFVNSMKSRSVTNGLGGAFDPPMVCIVRKGLAHRKPANYKTIPGDVVIIDFSLDYHNYKSDIARTLYFLKPGESQAPQSIRQAFNTVIESINETISFIEIGKKGWEVDEVARSIIEKDNYPTIRHAVGHQIGRETHDGGTIIGPQRKPKRLSVEGYIKQGEVYAIEPTVIQDNGLPCVLVEENILIKETGAEVLSNRQMELINIKYEERG